MKKRFLTVALTLLTLGVCAAVSDSGKLQIPSRPGKATKDILIFPQLEAHYGDFQNFLHYWKDRPLYVNPAHRYEGNKFTFNTEPSELKHIEQCISYNIAGLTPLGGLRTSEAIFDAAEKYDVKNFLIMPAVYLPGISYSSSANIKNLCAVLKRAIRSNKVFRHNGKVVVNSYEAASPQRTPAKIKEILDTARKEVGDGFIFVADLKIPLTSFYRKHYLPNPDRPDPVKVKEFVDMLQSYLDVCGGLYLGIAPRVSSYDQGGEYGTYYDGKFLDFIRPYIFEIYSRPQNKGKLLGVICTLGYVNHFSGMINAQEYGSETFRKSFESCLKLDPDFIVPFEWNEWNENTCFQPSVYKGAGYRRMIRYYQSLIDKSKKLTPLPGDDLSIPNMLFSYRYAYKLGDVMRFEMLNIPDGGAMLGDYKAQIVLKDVDGKVVHTLDEVSIKGDAFRAVTQTLPSEMFAAHQLLLPELTVTDSKGNKKVYAGNLYIRFTPTENRIFQYVRVALREAADVAVKEFKVTPNADGSYRVQGKVTAQEPLASVELLDNRTEMRALGEDNPEFDQNKNVIIQLTTTAAKARYLNGKIWIDNVSSCYARSAKQDGNNENFKFTVEKFGVNYQHGGIGKGNRKLFFVIPRSEADKAVIKGDLNLMEFSIPVADIMKYGTVAREFSECIYFRFDRFEIQPDIPVRLNKKEVAFDVNVFSDNEYPVFHLRMIGENGKLYRSKPIQMKKASGKPVALPVWSETFGKIVTVNVAKDRIPDAVYKFDPVPGAILHNTYSPRFNGEIGGGYRYSQPFSGTNTLIKDALTASAKWAKDEQGNNILRFDGIMSNITFEPEVFPRGAFTLECEFKPAGNGNMALFRHSAGHPGSIGAFIVNGKLFINYLTPGLSFRNMQTRLWTNPDAWNTLKITSDIKTLSVTLNGATQNFDNIGIGGLFRSFCVGGPVQNYGTPAGCTMFKGDLRKLRIYHNVEK